MQREDRKAAVAAYKERKVQAGVYAVRCTASGQVWVGSAPDLSTIQNRHWFTLRHGSNPHRTLQAAWTAHGEEAFTFDVVERFADDDPSCISDALPRTVHQNWVDRLSAIRI